MRKKASLVRRLKVRCEVSEDGASCGEHRGDHIPEEWIGGRAFVVFVGEGKEKDLCHK